MTGKERTILELYETNSAVQIATQLGIKKHIIYKILKDHNATRTFNQTNKLTWQKLGEWENEENLKQLYEKDQLSITEIANKYEVCKSAIRKALKRHGIRTRTTKEAMNLKKTKERCRNQTKERLSDQNEITKLKIRSKELWKNTEYREKNQSALKKKMQSQEYKDQMRKITSERYNDESYSKKLKPLISNGLRKCWENNEKFSKTIRELNKDFNQRVRKNPDSIQKMIENHRKAMQEPAYREKRSEIVRKMWQRPDYKKRMSIVRSQMSTTSSQQHILYEILDDLKIPYMREQMIGPHEIDCVISSHKIFIEVQGDWWHNQPERIWRDKAKASYVANNFPEYSLKYLWEHEFKCPDKVRNVLLYWLGLDKPDIVDFNIKKDVVIIQIDSPDVIKFLSKYHYIGTIGNNKIRLGYFVKDKLAGVVVYGPITRVESAIRLGYKPNEMLELTRLCIHPGYRKKNLASFMINKSIKFIPNNIKCLISFADSTFNHHGTIYKASNWKLDGIVEPSYWYVDKDGWVMHKKTLWDHAKSLRMKESEFAAKHGYAKVHGKEKYRYINKL